MTETERRMLAHRIARDLLTSGNGQHADRLVLMVDRPPGHNLGGWSEAALGSRIEALLRSLLEEAAPGGDRG